MPRTKCSLFIRFALPVFLSVLAHAQQPTINDPLLDHLAGTWVLQGMVADEETTHDIVGEWVLNHQYFRIHEVSREIQPNGQPGYEADFFIARDQGTNQYNCVWLDNTGGISPESFANAKRRGDEISFAFQAKDGVSVLTMAYNARSDSWHWRLDSVEHGALETFARVKLVKRN
jgi:hypothetical protein